MGKFVGKLTDAIGLTDIKGTQERANQAAAAQMQSSRDQIEAAKIAAEMAKFKPYNITTALGGVRFGKQRADITYNPELAAYRDRLFSLASTILPEDIRSAEEEEYRRLVEGSRSALEQQTAALGQGLFRSGRQGLDIFGANPELRAFAAAQMDRELGLRQAAEQQIANRIAQSTGLFTSGAGVEATLMQPLELGANLGGRAAQAGAQAGQLLSSGSQAAARMAANAALTQQQGGNAASQQLTGFMNQVLGAAAGRYMSQGSLFGGGSSGGGGGYFGGIGQQPVSAPSSIYSIY